IVASVAQPNAATDTRARAPLPDGIWYGRMASVSVKRRTIVMTTACKLTKSGRWVTTRHVTASVAIARHAGFTIYYRPNGDAVAGHAQSATLTTVGSIVSGGPSSDFPAGWAVTVSPRQGRSPRGKLRTVRRPKLSHERCGAANRLALVGVHS